MTEFEILAMAHGLLPEGWEVEIVDDDTYAGFTVFSSRTVTLSRAYLSTPHEANVHELVRHEAAHALCGHGRHDLEWWGQLAALGGDGVWLTDEGEPAAWSWTRAEVERVTGDTPEIHDA